MYQRILVPYDGSATSTRGLDEAIRLAKLTGASVRLLHLIDALVYATGFESGAVYCTDVIPYIREAGEKVLLDGKLRAERAGLKADSVIVDSIATRLCDAVNDQVRAWGADLIVIGTHGRRGVGRLLLGSDAEQIVRSASVPVLLVRSVDLPGVAATPAAEASSTETSKVAVTV